MIVTIFTLGGLVGSLSADRATRYLGRTGVLRVAEVGLVGGAILVGVANSMAVMIIGRYDFLHLRYTEFPTCLQREIADSRDRLLIGFSAGFVLVTVPLYLDSIAPKRYRKMFGIMHQIWIGLGMITAQSLSLAFAKLWVWRYVLLIGTGLGGLVFVGGLIVGRLGTGEEKESRDEADEETSLVGRGGESGLDPMQRPDS